MKILKAQNYLPNPDNLPHLKIQQVEVDKLFILTDHNWMMKRYPLFEKHMSAKGMQWPIVYTSEEHHWNPPKEKRWPRDLFGYIPGLGVHTGNKRVYWAKRNGYTHIEGYFVKSKDEKDSIVSKTMMRDKDYTL